MLATIKPNSYRWLGNGEVIFAALTDAINAAQKTIRLEVYTYANDDIGKRILETLLNARERGVRVQVLIDAVGSLGLSDSFWDSLVTAGGEVHWFNPILRGHFAFRDHRKLLVCDEEIAFVGGFNMTTQYYGDGINSGWCDLGLEITSPLAVQLAAAFDEMFAQSGPQYRLFKRFSSAAHKRGVTVQEGKVLLSGPGRGRNPFHRELLKDLARARSVQIICAYFVPPRRIRRNLMRLARQGAKVQLILAGKSDVYISQLAGRSLYRRLLNAGVEIYEYKPQILHAKLVIVDNAVYVGSSNLDPRSLHINYELMVRLADRKVVADGRALFSRKLEFCERIELEAWKKSRSWWRRFKQRWAYFLLVQVDPLVARWRFRQMKRDGS